MQKKIFILLFFLFSFTFQAFSSLNDPSRYTQTSVLSEGTWYKVKIAKTGIYKLTYKDLKKMGLKNPQNVKIFGYGGGILNEDFTGNYVDDLPPISYWMSTSLDEFKNDTDYILFYAKGSITWNYNSVKQEFEQTQDPYTFDSYYFITENDKVSTVMDMQNSLPESTDKITAFDDYFLYEQDLVNVGETGREFYGENFLKTPSVSISLDTEGVTSDPAILRYEFISKVFPSSATMNISLNGEALNSIYTPTSNDYYTIAVTSNGSFTVSNLQNKNTVTFNYSKNTSDKNVYLNYLRLSYKRLLKPYSAVTFFRSTNLSSNLTYEIGDATSSLLVLDVTDVTTPKLINTKLDNSTLSFTADNSTIREYAIVDLSKSNEISTPLYQGDGLGLIKNQNLHGLESVDMVVIVNEYLKDYAQELADLHKQNSDLNVILVDPEQIYNEFSSGKPDATAYRRFMKMFYDRGLSNNKYPKYLLLFGGGSYDNRQIQDWATNAKKSMLLTYQSHASLLETSSFVTDDYFGFLDDDSTPLNSTKEYTDFTQSKQKLSIGRIPVRDQSSAANIVSKIRDYMDGKDDGIWKNTVSFIADDAIAGSDSHTTASINEERKHMIDAEALSDYITDNYPDFVVKKIYEDMFERKIESNGARYPDATRALINQINNGTLFLNFIGHGATNSWTHEYLLSMSEIESLNNTKLPLWITITCDFSRFDANATSGGETALLKESGGAIGLFSTVRVVLTGLNRTMNTSLMKYIFEKENNENPRLGDIIRKAKNDASLNGDTNKLRFLLLGDPALKLSYPEKEYSVQVLEMNDRDADAIDINIQALDDTSIKGAVLDNQGNIVTDFNGLLQATIFDAKQILHTRGNKSDGTQDPDKVGIDYDDYTNTLFSGKIEIKNGEFEINFVAPKDILYADDNGKMSFYAIESSGGRNAQGSFYNYTIGGTNTNRPEENNPPVISKMYLNTEQFKSGDYVNSTPLFYAEVSDDTGINLSSALGHTMSLFIDGTIVADDLASYFQNEDNSNKKGHVTYTIPQLTEGKHSLQFTVWDVWNNSTTETLEFIVTDDFRPKIYSFEIWGNPAKDYTRFVINTNIPSSNIDVTFRVYSLTGSLVWMTQQIGAADNMSRYIYDWDLTSNRQGRLLPGIYLCTAEVTVDGQRSSVKAAKLIVTEKN